MADGNISQTRQHTALAGWFKPARFTMSSAALDAGNTGQTHILRRGLVLGRVTTGGELKEYDDGDADGTEVAFAILLEEVDLKSGDPTASSTDKPCTAFRLATDIVNAALIGIDAAGVVDLEALGCNFV